MTVWMCAPFGGIGNTTRSPINMRRECDYIMLDILTVFRNALELPSLNLYRIRNSFALAAEPSEEDQSPLSALGSLILTFGFGKFRLAALCHKTTEKVGRWLKRRRDEHLINGEGPQDVYSPCPQDWASRSSP